MNALRKPEALTGGFKIGFLAAQARHLTGDETKLLLLLVHHIGAAGCFPSQETLCEETGWSQRKVRRIRDALAAKDLIGFVAGTGHRSTRYSIPGVIEWADQQKQKTAPRMPESAGQGLPPGGTEHLNTKLNTEAGKPDLKVVGIEPKSGWPAVVHQAPDHQRNMWLGKLTFDGQDADGTIRLTAPNTFIQSTVKKMLEEDPAIAAILAKLGIDPAMVKIRAAKPPGADLPADRTVREGEPGGFDERRSKARQLRQNLNHVIPDKLEALSDQPVVPSGVRPHCNKVTDLAAYRTKRPITDISEDS